jgi:hypothetical protein
MAEINDAASTATVERATPSAPALRMRRHRERRRKGLRCLTLQVRDREIDALVRKGLLTDETRNVVGEINAAFYKFLDLTLGFDAVTRNRTPVTRHEKSKAYD